MDLPALKFLKTSQLEDLADGYHALSAGAGQGKDDIENSISAKMRVAKLAGLGADAAHKQLSEVAENFHYIQVECGLVSTALRAFVSDISPAKAKFDAAIADAAAHKFTVADSGFITYPAGGGEEGEPATGGTAMGLADPSNRAVARQNADFDPNPHHAVAQDIADRICDALREATAADDRWAPQLRKLMADDDLTVSPEDWADAQKDMAGVDKDAKTYLSHLKPPPKGGRPEDNADWWKSLSPQDQADYLAAYPGRIGALDGLPADVRDEANRTVLSETRGDYQAKLDAIGPEPTEYENIMDPSGRGVKTAEWLYWKSQYDALQPVPNRLKGMDAIQDRFDATGTSGANGTVGLPEAYLLGFDPEGKGDGKVILANGNPDTAEHTAIYVPGTTTKIDKIGGDINRGVSLWQASSETDPNAKISTITWFDYNAPNNIPAAIHDSYAHDGAPALRGFLDGNAAAHEAATGGRAHTTLIGHSYGSTLIGDTAKYSYPHHDGAVDPLPVDDVVAVGSPGMQAKHPGDLGLDPTHMWAEGGGGLDHLVRDGGRFTGLGGGGNIPTDPAFGGNVMWSDADNHSAYWDSHNGQPSVSLQNQADVIVGQYDHVQIMYASPYGPPRQ
ncbi:alpha/beta hydrolase family protein [Streptomyces cocklensis]|uniref:Alpha/beta hydrolase n=1 Tax=Actinacidiphila cocklensis TaxID=887465 RepID=A0A9W4GNZ7_9ACTN|nr:alpha/beta hydrolase [Actinacidiphila cocklensis]MDD1062580.1 alpha/beta hydrolase family protein [Actinacidiphila cocklensis]CAG6391858.1 Alpha/beta hydrolase [Actinacidiphila cocklensis]